MRRHKRIFPIFMVFLLFSLAGCSASSKDESAKMNDGTSSTMNSSKAERKDQASLGSSVNDVSNKSADVATIPAQNQMVIYLAELQLRVRKFDQTVRTLEEKAEKYGGYIAKSDVTREGREQVSGSLTIRIPQKHFQTFLHDAEGYAAEVLQRNITGQDVTEEYIDLKSRLKSKRIVEERLLAFMKGATKTEDLLKISADLAAVQEEIETIEGKMKFLENQTSYATVTITLYENKVIVPNIDQEQLNTWEKIKKQFMKSTNLLLVGLSELVVFLLGNMPILLILAIIGFVSYLLFIKKKKNNNQ